MNVTITQFNSPFSFFCKTYDAEVSPVYNISKYKNEINKIEHGQFVAIFWLKKWVRGVVEKTDKFLIWLIDYGVYFTPCKTTMCVSLSPLHKRIPSNVFQASIHGVVPLELDINFDGLESEMSTIWSHAALARAKEAISKAVAFTFVPVAVLNTEHNNIVLGDLYIKTQIGGKAVNLIDTLEEWPKVISRNKNTYIQNLSQLYLEHKKHPFGNRITDIPSISVNVTVEEYNAICSQTVKPSSTTQIIEPDQRPEPEVPDTDTDSEEGSIEIDCDELLTPKEIELYAHQYVIMAGKKRNVLEILKHKMFDTIMCQKYKNHDLKGVGRAVTRGRMYEPLNAKM